MKLQSSYRKAFFAAIFLHLSLAVVLLLEPSHQRSVMTQEKQNTAVPEVNKKADQIVKAVSVDSSEVKKTIDRIKEERAKQIREEQSRQQALAKQAEKARQARVQEQQKLAKLKEEADKIAIARKKQIEKEQERLKQLAQQKIEEAKRIQELKAKQELLKKKQKEEAEKLAQMKTKQAEEKYRQAKIQAEKEKAELAKREEAAAQQAALANAERARLAGEVNKYKAMIVDAISRQWILPENADNRLSSQFRIRLAPNGTVLEVSLTRSSGDPILDRSAQTAIYKASPLPVPHDPATFDLFRDISLTVRPENARG